MVAQRAYLKLDWPLRSNLGHGQFKPLLSNEAPGANCIRNYADLDERYRHASWHRIESTT
jgi:hypothetical protein